MSGITLESLVGKHILDGVDMLDEEIRWDYNPYCEYSQIIRFRLDEIIYLAIEDPVDGYRSCMKELQISNTPMKNTFSPQRITARHRDGVDDILELICVDTGKTVLEIGTEAFNDYYPTFVGRFHPENF